MTDLGFIGLGQMGAPMAERLLAPDVRLHVHDANPAAMAAFVQKGAVAHHSPASVADAAPIVFACLPSQSVSRAVAAGLADGRVVQVYAEMSTIGRETIAGIAETLGARGIAVVDAPISGGPPGARAGTLAMMAALGHHEEFKLHIRASRNTGATPADIAEVLIQVAAYGGIPAANSAVRIAKETFKEMDAS